MIAGRGREWLDIPAVDPMRHRNSKDKLGTTDLHRNFIKDKRDFTSNEAYWGSSMLS